MATLPEMNEYPAGIYQIETTDPVLGGPPNEASKAGLINIPALQLAKRTNWLKVRVDQLVTKVIAATTTVAGIVRLSNSTGSTSEIEAATPRAVKAAWDNAESRALKSTTVTPGGLATGGGNLGANIAINVPIATQAEAETGSADNRAMTPLKVMQAIVVRLSGRSIDTAGLAIGGGPLSADRTISVPDATQAEAQAGTIATKAMSPLRVAQAIAARMADRSVRGTGLATGGGSLAADRDINVPAATLAEAEAGESSTKAMTPVATRRAIVSSFSQSANANGYVVLPSGLIFQWGRVITDGNGNGTVTFPIAFPASALQVIVGDWSDNLDLAGSHINSVSDVTRTAFKVMSVRWDGLQGGSAVPWFAIGR